MPPATAAPAPKPKPTPVPAPAAPAAGGQPDDKAAAIDAILDQLHNWGMIGGRARKAESLVKQIQHATDVAASRRVRAIQHAEKFQRLEASYLGLTRLVTQARPGQKVQIRVLSLSFAEAEEDLDHPAGLEHSQLHRRLIDEGIGVLGGTPTAALLGDYEFGPAAEHLAVLRNFARLGEKGKFPILTNAAPALANLNSWTDLASPRAYRNLARIEELDEFADYRSLREDELSRYIALALPRVLARRPYGSAKTCRPVKEFGYEETELNDFGQALPLASTHYTWCGAAWALAERILEAATRYGIAVAIFGPEAGGAVRDLPMFVPVNPETGESEPLCPSEVSIPFAKEGILSELGFLPLVHKKKTNMSAFLSSQLLRRPKDDLDPDKAADEELAATLAYQLARFRLLHHLVKYTERLLGKPLTLTAIEERLNQWLTQFVLDSEPSEELCNEYPFAAAKVTVIPDPKKPGVYRIVLRVAPWIKLKAVIASAKLTQTVKKASTAGA